MSLGVEELDVMGQVDVQTQGIKLSMKSHISLSVNLY
jgi:hypothetical protein